MPDEERPEQHFVVREAGGESLRVYWSTFKGRRRLHIRSFFRDDENAWQPTRKGVSILERDVESLVRCLSACLKKDSSSSRPETDEEIEKIARELAGR